MKDEERVVIAEGPVSTELGAGERAVLNLSTGVYYSLNEVGGYVWRQLGEPVTVAELVHRVTSAFAVDSDTARSDLDTLLGGLLTEGLIKRVP